MQSNLTAAETAAGLRELADWLDTFPELGSLIAWGQTGIIYCSDATRFAVAYHAIGGGEPEVSKNGKWAETTREFGPFNVCAYAPVDLIFDERLIGTAPVLGHTVKPGVLDLPDEVAA